MDNLKPCPFCGSNNVSFYEDEEQLLEGTTTGFIWCHGCDFSSDSFYSEKIAAEKWNRRAQPENKPLTLDELMEMAKEPLKHWVWIDNLTNPKESAYLKTHKDYTHGEAFCCGSPGFTWEFEYTDYGKTWLAYRSKPKEEHNEAD